MKPLHILLLEDTNFHADLIETALTANDISCTITRVEKREDFLAMLQRQSFDTILVDYLLPDFDGLTALRLAREQAPDTPVILVSGVLGEEAAISLQTFFRNISERKTLERQQAEFLAMLTHDIRTPIGAILGYTEILLEEANYEVTSDEADILQRIRGNALALHGLVTNYLDLSQIEAGTLQVVKEPVVLTDLLRRVGEQYAPEAQRHGLTLHVLLPDTFPLIAGAPVALERVFANLVTNAIKFTPSGGQITVRAERRGGEVVVTVADTGPGIVEGERERIFEKYRTGGGRQGGEGTGLGLFIVKSLVEGHGGRVVVNCPASGGTEFLVSFPVLGS